MTFAVGVFDFVPFQLDAGKGQTAEGRVAAVKSQQRVGPVCPHLIVTTVNILHILTERAVVLHAVVDNKAVDIDDAAELRVIDFATVNSNSADFADIVSRRKICGIDHPMSGSQHKGCHQRCQRNSRFCRFAFRMSLCQL